MLAQMPQRRVGSGDVHSKTEYKVQYHTESAITQGREYKEAAPRQTQNDLLQHMEKMVNTIFACWNINSVVVGRNDNAERLASSNELVDLQVQRYGRYKEQIRAKFQSAIIIICEEITGSKEVYVDMVPCIDEATLNKVQAVLKKERLITHMSCVFSMQEEDFDESKIKKYQEVQLDPKGLDERDRPKSTSEQKSANSHAKHQASES
jgi:hypothetical protein